MKEEFEILKGVYADKEMKVKEVEMSEMYGITKQAIGIVKNRTLKRLKNNAKLKNIYNNISNY